MAIVYAHYRKTDNEIFYIGIGKSEKRAYSKHSRNPYWGRIVNKCNLTVDIIASDLTWEQACEFEILLINFYGRADLGKGPICNLTDGGEGIQNLSQVTIEKIRQNAKNRVPTQSVINTLYDNSMNLRVPVIQYSEEGVFIKEFESIASAGREVGASSTSITSCAKGLAQTAKGFIWRYKDPKLWFDPILKYKRDSLEYELSKDRSYRDCFKNKNDRNKRPVLQYDMQGVFVKRWDYIAQVSKVTGIKHNHIHDCCNNLKGRKSCKGFLWVYEESEVVPEYVNNKNSSEVVFNRKFKIYTPVNQYTKKGEFIKRWSCSTEAGTVLGIIPRTITACCNKGKHRVTAGGFKCEFVEERKVVPGKSKPILQLDLEDNFIKEWPSARQVQLSLNIHQTQVSQCCKSKYLTAGGFKWQYKN